MTYISPKTQLDNVTVPKFDQQQHKITLKSGTESVTVVASPIINREVVFKTGFAGLRERISNFFHSDKRINFSLNLPKTNPSTQFTHSEKASVSISLRSLARSLGVSFSELKNKSDTELQADLDLMIKAQSFKVLNKKEMAQLKSLIGSKPPLNFFVNCLKEGVDVQVLKDYLEANKSAELRSETTLLDELKTFYVSEVFKADSTLPTKVDTFILGMDRFAKTNVEVLISSDLVDMQLFALKCLGKELSSADLNNFFGENPKFSISEFEHPKADILIDAVLQHKKFKNIESAVKLRIHNEDLIKTLTNQLFTANASLEGLEAHLNSKDIELTDTMLFNYAVHSKDFKSLPATPTDFYRAVRVFLKPPVPR